MRSFNLRRLNGLENLHAALGAETTTGRDKVTHDHVLFETTQEICFPESCRIRQNTGCVLETGSRNKALGLQRGLGDSKENRLGFCRFTSLLLHLLVHPEEFRALNLIAPKERGIPRIGYPDLAQHLADNNLNMLIIDLHSLETINLLHLGNQMLHQCMGSQDLKDFMRHHGTISK